jgi:MFS family permease
VAASSRSDERRGGAGPGHRAGDLPAASTIFTDPAQYDLSSTQYGTMFLPQVVTAIIASLLGGRLARRLGSKRVYLAGLLANLASMALLIVSQFVAATRSRTASSDAAFIPRG